MRSEQRARAAGFIVVLIALITGVAALFQH